MLPTRPVLYENTSLPAALQERRDAQLQETESEPKMARAKESPVAPIVRRWQKQGEAVGEKRGLLPLR